MPDLPPLELAYAADATTLFSRLLELPRPVLLHSADRRSRFGRYDIMSAAPTTPISFRDGVLTIGTARTITQKPLTALGERFNPVSTPASGSDSEPAVPFRSGFLGYFGYPLHQYLERQNAAPTSPAGLPDLWGGLYRWSIVTDHRRGTTTLYAPDVATQQRVLATVNAPARERQPVTVSPFKSSLSNAGYQEAFARTQSYIESGDCYQVNLAQHFEARFEGHPFDLYQDWLPRQPAPFCAYLGIDASQAIVSLSPERFVRLAQGMASVSPIKGTRPRSNHPNRDAMAKLALLSSHKDRAENLMIVDLLRNDLGRVARSGTVQVRHLFEPVSFDNVHHLVSTIEARLHSKLGAIDLLRALFPCGSVTGAPKIRAMDIINELEPVGRSVYCGAIGYIDERGSMDLSVTIRTAVAAQQRLHLWGGGGLVADSQATIEQEEIEDKIGRLLKPSSAHLGAEARARRQ